MRVAFPSNLGQCTPNRGGLGHAKKYVVRLTDAEREILNSLVKKQRVSAQKVLRARVLLKTDVDGPR